MPGGNKHKFQVHMGGQWHDYSQEEHQILVRAFMSGSRKARYNFRGQDYEYDFAQMLQKNADSGKERRIRPPYGLKPPPAPRMKKPGPTMMVVVPVGGMPGAPMTVPHPQNKAVQLRVVIPPGASPGSTLLVPVPELNQNQQPMMQPQQNPPPPMVPQPMYQQQPQQPMMQPQQPMYQQPPPMQQQQQPPLQLPNANMPPQQQQQQQPPLQQQQPMQTVVLPGHNEPKLKEKEKKSGTATGTTAMVGAGLVGGAAVGAGAYYVMQNPDSVDAAQDFVCNIDGDQIVDIGQDMGEAIGDFGAEAGNFILNLF